MTHAIYINMLHKLLHNNYLYPTEVKSNIDGSLTSRFFSIDKLRQFFKIIEKEGLKYNFNITVAVVCEPTTFPHIWLHVIGPQAHCCHYIFGATTVLCSVSHFCLYN